MTTAAAEFAVELARRQGRVTAEQVAAAAERQEASADEFGQTRSLTACLLETGAITERGLAELLAAEFGLEFVRLDGVRIDGGALATVSREQAREQGICPLEINETGIRLAVTDPLATDAVDEIGRRLNRPVETVVAPADEIRRAIDRHYGGEADATGMEAATEGATGPDAAVSADEWAAGDQDDAPVIQLVHTLIAEAIRQHASDIHLEPLERRFRVRYRIDGRLHEMENPPKRLQLPLISRVKIMAQLSIAEKRLPQDGRMQVKLDGRPVDLRVATVPTAHGESIVMRLLDQAGLKRGLPELGLLADDEAALRRLIGLADGIVLVTGPTGSGKTTTLYSCLHHLNRSDRKIITVEDPVEYQLSGINQVPVRPEVGLTFAAALRAMLRQAPNVVKVGEIRDQETAEIAINASLTGHLVFSTLHTNDAPGAVTRLTDLGVKSFLVANSLRAVVAQRLVRRVCVQCRRPVEPTAAERRWLDGVQLAEAPAFCAGAGCEACRGTGFRGRVAIFEFFVVNPEVERMIHDHAGLAQLRQCARRLGMRSLREDGLRKAAAGFTTIAEVISATVGDPV